MERAGTPDSGRDPGDEDAAAPPVAIVASVARHLPDDMGRADLMECWNSGPMGAQRTDVA
jgi:hypothetical protein